MLKELERDRVGPSHCRPSSSIVSVSDWPKFAVLHFAASFVLLSAKLIMFTNSSRPPVPNQMETPVCCSMTQDKLSLSAQCSSRVLFLWHRAPAGPARYLTHF